MQDQPSQQSDREARIRRRREAASAQQADPRDTPRNVRAAALVLAVAFGMMTVFNSSQLRSAARDLPGYDISDRMVDAADAWHELMLVTGPAHVQPAVRAAFDRFRTLRW